MNRRQFLLAGGAVMCTGIALPVSKYLPDTGLTHPCLTTFPTVLTEHPSWQRVWQGIQTDQVWDAHVHLVGVGDHSQETWFNPAMDEWLHPQLKLQKAFYINATCADEQQIDQSTVERMDALTQTLPVGMKLMLFAFDWHRDAQGKVLKQQSIFHISNHYAASIAQRNPAR